MLKNFLKNINNKKNFGIPAQGGDDRVCRSLKTKNYKPQTNKGFTILETLVAILILTLSITGPMVFAQSGLRTSFLARDQITAFYLAQDIIETIKNLRDENALSGRDWMTNIDACNTPGPGTPSDPCVIKIDTTVVDPVAERCVGGECGFLQKDSVGRFTYDGDENSRFTRTTYISETVDGKETQIVVDVEWESAVKIGRTRIIVQENIYNWIPLSTTG